LYKLPERIAVLGAFPIEVELIGEALVSPDKISKKGFLTCSAGSFNSRMLLVGYTGMGKVKAASGIQAAVDLFCPGLVLFCGTAGGLSCETSPLDIIIATRFLEYDAGPKKPNWTKTEPTLVSFLEKGMKSIHSEDHIKVRCGPLITGDKPVLDSDTKKILAQEFNALAVDMEAAAAGAVAAANSIPFAVIKGITDSADKNGLKDFKKNVRKSAAQVQRALMNLLDQ